MTGEIVEFGGRPAPVAVTLPKVPTNHLPVIEQLDHLRSWCYAATLAQTVILAQLMAIEVKRSPAMAARHASLKRESLDLLSRATMAACDIEETRRAAAKIIAEIFSYITVT